MENIERITNAAMNLAAQRASAMSADATFTASDVAAAVMADPTGETARYVAQLIAWGVEWLLAFRRCPEAMEVFGASRIGGA